MADSVAGVPPPPFKSERKMRTCIVHLDTGLMTGVVTVEQVHTVTTSTDVS